MAFSFFHYTIQAVINFSEHSQDCTSFLHVPSVLCSYTCFNQTPRRSKLLGCYHLKQSCLICIFSPGTFSQFSQCLELSGFCNKIKKSITFSTFQSFLFPSVHFSAYRMTTSALGGPRTIDCVSFGSVSAEQLCKASCQVPFPQAPISHGACVVHAKNHSKHSKKWPQQNKDSQRFSTLSM